MKHRFLAFLVALVSTLMIAFTASAQRNVTPAIDRDPLLEADAKHNLDVARQAFAPLKKAYKQVIMRFEETFFAYPDFLSMDEFLYLAGMSSYYLSENKGNQKVDLNSEKEREKFDPGKLKDDAVGYLSTLIERYPDSKFKPQAAKTLAELKSMTWTSPVKKPPPVLNEN